jgi:hypothetical protein
LGCDSTMLLRSKSGATGSKAAHGRAEGIFDAWRAWLLCTAQTNSLLFLMLVLEVKRILVGAAGRSEAEVRVRQLSPLNDSRQKVKTAAQGCEGRNEWRKSGGRRKGDGQSRVRYVMRHEARPWLASRQFDFLRM